jgi:RimJ/RimL family protein N-acetyltransferase
MASRAPMSEQLDRPQALLVGDEIFLRPLVPTDAETSPIWSASPWPAPPDIVKEQIEQELGSNVGAEFQQQQFLVCRRADQTPVGSVTMIYARQQGTLVRFALGPSRAHDDWAWVCSQTVPVVLPWLIDDRSIMSVRFEFPGEHPLVDRMAAQLGIRRCFRIRERNLLGGTRYDTIGYQAFHPAWVEKLGAPPEMSEGPDERESPAAVPQAGTPRYTVPPSAIVAGERLYLRAFSGEDAECATRGMLSETEVSFAEGRMVFNPHISAQFARERARRQPPSWARFAIVVGETGEAIGANGLIELNMLERSAETETAIWSAAHRGQGYGTEAKHLLLEYAFDVLGLHMVCSWISDFNQRSVAAIRKQGYRDAGYIAWCDYHGTKLYGSYCFDLLASEWRAARR